MPEKKSSITDMKTMKSRELSALVHSGKSVSAKNVEANRKGTTMAIMVVALPMCGKLNSLGKSANMKNVITEYINTKAMVLPTTRMRGLALVLLSRKGLLSIWRSRSSPFNQYFTVDFKFCLFFSERKSMFHIRDSRAANST